MREHAHQLLDKLDPSRLASVVHLHETFLEEETDTLSTTEAMAIAEAEEWSKNHEPIPHEQVLKELGLTAAEWERMSLEP